MNADGKFHNMKPREVHCYLCDETTTTDEPFPKCNGCGNNLITVVRSALNSRRFDKDVVGSHFKELIERNGTEQR